MNSKPRPDTGISSQAATGQPQQQRLGPRLLWNPEGWKPPGKLLPTSRALHRAVLGNRFYPASQLCCCFVGFVHL